MSPKSSFSKHTKKLSITKLFATISENRVYCNNEPTNYQIWCIPVFITTFISVHFSQKQEENNAFCRIYLSSFSHLFKMQCSSIVIKTFQYHSFASIIFSIDQSICWGLLWFDLPRKVSWTLLWRLRRKVILLEKWLIF